MTMGDIENLRINQLEDLLIGLDENAKQEQKMLEGANNDVEVLEGDDAIRALLGEE